jgi:hypothetical protein
MINLVSALPKWSHSLILTIFYFWTWTMVTMSTASPALWDTWHQQLLLSLQLSNNSPSPSPPTPFSLLCPHGSTYSRYFISCSVFLLCLYLTQYFQGLSMLHYASELHVCTIQLYPFIYQWTLGPFLSYGYCWIMQLWTLMYKCLFESLFSITLCICLRQEFLGHMVIISSVSCCLFIS